MTRDDIIRMTLVGEQSLKDRISYAIALEREECAKLCEMVEDDDLYFGSQYAAAIRERGAP
jgi:hypothetical protein